MYKDYFQDWAASNVNEEDVFIRPNDQLVTNKNIHILYCVMYRDADAYKKSFYFKHDIIKIIFLTTFIKIIFHFKYNKNLFNPKYLIGKLIKKELYDLVRLNN
jgi:hypothetical protein